ncbi:hypothetical protein MKEN_01154700 [Mycena kentingensis (nom. inval.)]|nr:hypothetical protein MKEN_01154700 [Mycena kentingensis (nom. inval.)]
MAHFYRFLTTPALANIRFQEITLLMNLLGVLKNDILLAQPNTVPVTTAPLLLPDAIVAFIRDATTLPAAAVKEAWTVLREEVWSAHPATLSASEKELFRKYGWQRGLTWITLFPPTHRCVNKDCTNHPSNPQSTPLKRSQSRQVILYSIADGVIPAWSIHLACDAFYYTDIPAYLQIGDHQFAEHKLVSMWISQMLTSWVSATNCARAYDLSLSGSDEYHAAIAAGGWQFGTELTTEHVWDAFVLLVLLELRQRNNERLIVPHGGDQKDRFTEAMKERNREVVKNGQDVVGHACDKCVRNFEGKDYQVVVADGLAMGHPCCGVKHCMNTLESTRDRYCLEHQSHNDDCSIVGCDVKAVPGTKTCADPAHVEVERVYKLEGQSAFKLKALYRKQQLSHPDEVGVGEEVVLADVTDAENEATYTVRVNEQNEVEARVDHEQHPGSIGVDDEKEPAVNPCPSTKDPNGKKLKAKFGLSKTHTEFAVSFACGVFSGRLAMHTSEATSTALTATQKIFSVPGAVKPEHFVYDTACDALQQVMAKGNEERWKWFRDIRFSVDVFHFRNKHAVTHEFCQRYCNPSRYPELMRGDKWYFNTSVAEQNNVWLGGYHSMCRGMSAVKYNFFLDEMVRRRNVLTLAKLEDAGANPRIRIAV